MKKTLETTTEFEKYLTYKSPILEKNIERLFNSIGHNYCYKKLFQGLCKSLFNRTFKDIMINDFDLLLEEITLCQEVEPISGDGRCVCGKPITNCFNVKFKNTELIFGSCCIEKFKTKLKRYIKYYEFKNKFIKAVKSNDYSMIKKLRIHQYFYNIELYRIFGRGNVNDLNRLHPDIVSKKLLADFPPIGKTQWNKNFKDKDVTLFEYLNEYKLSKLYCKKRRISARYLINYGYKNIINIIKNKNLEKQFLYNIKINGYLL